MSRRLACAAALICSFAFVVTLPAQDASDKVERILNRIEESAGADLWSSARELETLGPSALAPLRKGLTRANPWPRIAIAKVLYAADAKDESLDALGKVVEGSKVPAARRAAADMAGALLSADKALDGARKRQFAGQLKQQALEIDDDLTRVALWRAVWSLTESIDPKRAVRDLLESSKNPDVKDEAALALADMGAFVWAKGRLKELATQPGERGRLARIFLQLNALNEDYARASSGAGKYDYKMLEEIIDKLKAHYHDPAKIDEAKLIEAAARGLMASLDPHSAYYDEKTIEAMHKELEGHYGGIGARVSMRKDKGGNAWLTITEPIFSGPAYKAGLRSDDTITEVEGESTVNQDINDIIRRLRGKPGTEACIKVIRRGWPKEREFKIVRAEVQLETTMARMLPGSVGYISYTDFGDLDEELRLKGTNFETELRGLAGKGMKSLILDLRGNGGGLLRSAVRIASLFLPKGTLIATTRSQGEEKERYAARGGVVTDVPMVVLIDEGSASASEILSGALKDHKRALVVGEKSYGKGSVQDLKYLAATDKKTAARMTIALWYLPGGKSVSNEDPKLAGVDPDIKVSPPERDYWKVAEFEKLRADGRVEDYVVKHFAAHRDLFRKLAESDGNDPARYPDFDALFDSLGTRLSKVEVRELVREFVRSKVQDDQGAAFYLDFQTDVQLQRAILEACARGGVDPKAQPDYSTFAQGEAPAK